jgi:hypothetical protein
MTESPQDFDFDAWLDGAERPERAVTVYQKANLIADLDVLAERIKNAEQDGDHQIDERGLGEQSEIQKLSAEYQRIAQQFHDSALTLRIAGHSETEKREFAKANPDAPPSELGGVILADAIRSPKITPEQVRRLEAKLGPAQFALIYTAYQQACTEVPVVSADFLPKPSSRGDGGES